MARFRASSLVGVNLINAHFLEIPGLLQLQTCREQPANNLTIRRIKDRRPFPPVQPSDLVAPSLPILLLFDLVDRHSSGLVVGQRPRMIARAGVDPNAAD